MHVHTIGIVCLSSGSLGEPYMRHERMIGEKRLAEMEIRLRYLPHALAGREYIQDHPEKRAEDLLTAFRDPEIDMILCAIGGDDTYRLAPYLFADDAIQKAAAGSHKIFLGFSDTTLNHLMLPYTARYFRELIETGTIRKVRPSTIWYECRTDFSPEQIGVPLHHHAHEGFTLLQGSPRFHGRILGGCIDSLYDMFSPERYADMPEICAHYGLFPSAEDWRGRILLLETSEEKMEPQNYRKALLYLKNAGVFGAISGILHGKPMDGAYEEAYQSILCDVIGDATVPVLWGVNIGHALPRCILPFGVETSVDAEAQVIRIVG